MSRDEQRATVRLQRETLIEELEAVYRNAFDRLGALELGEGSVARLTNCCSVHGKVPSIR